MSLRVLLLWASVGALVGFGCSVKFSDDVRYRCTSDGDCGGEGFVCVANGESEQRVCCKPTGEEVCDQRDNDCNGVADDSGKTEVCNGQDDDCDGLTDEGFFLATDIMHCGRCNNPCGADDICRNGSCQMRVEQFCFDNFDDDMNGETDCEDPSCENRSCGAACVCKGLVKTEALCSDGADNDGDGATDCFDTDCSGKACRAGCTCAADGGQLETDCTEGTDNDQDGQADCLDADCVDKFCTPPEIYFQCTAMQQCRCNGGVQVAEVGSVLCRDGVDNDCDGEVDCREVTCDTQPCGVDGGTECVCANRVKKEAACDNLKDDDGDSAADCTDPDCAQGVSCSKPDGGGAGTCSSTRTCD